MKKYILCLVWLFSFSALFAQGNEKPVIVFDFGGVIGDSDKDVLCDRTAHELGISEDKAFELVDGYYESKRQGRSSRLFWSEQAEKGWSFPERWRERFEAIRRECIIAFPGMMELVEVLRSKGYRVAMLSNVTPDRAAVIRSQGLYEPFDPLILSYEIGVSKPDKRAWEILLDALGGIAPRRCIFIDDKLRNTIVADEMGFDSIVFVSHEDLCRQLERRGICLRQGGVQVR